MSQGYCELLTHIDGLAQDCSNSSAIAMELLQSCTKPAIWFTVLFIWAHHAWCIINLLIIIYTLRPEQKWLLFCKQHFQRHFLEKLRMFCIFIQISIWYFFWGFHWPKSCFVQVLAWHRTEQTPSHKPNKWWYLTHTCITMSQYFQTNLDTFTSSVD